MASFRHEEGARFFREALAQLGTERLMSIRRLPPSERVRFCKKPHMRGGDSKHVLISPRRFVVLSTQKTAQNTGIHSILCRTVKQQHSNKVNEHNNRVIAQKTGIVDKVPRAA